MLYPLSRGEIAIIKHHYLGRDSELIWYDVPKAVRSKDVFPGNYGKVAVFGVQRSFHSLIKVLPEQYMVRDYLEEGRIYSDLQEALVSLERYV